MIKVIMMLVTGLVLFGISATVSTMMKPKAEDSESENGQSEMENASVDSSAKLIEGSTYTTPVSDTAMPQLGVSAETVLRLSEAIKRREKELQQREKAITNQESRIKFMFDDLKRERDEITTMLAEVESHAQKSRNMLEQVDEVNTANSEAGGGGTSGSGDSYVPDGISSEQDSENLQTISAWLKAMPQEQAGATVRQMCNDGKMEMVVRVLSFLEERDAASVLAALEDSALVAELLERYRSLKHTN